MQSSRSILIDYEICANRLFWLGTILYEMRAFNMLVSFPIIFWEYAQMLTWLQRYSYGWKLFNQCLFSLSSGMPQTILMTATVMVSMDVVWHSSVCKESETWKGESLSLDYEFVNVVTLSIITDICSSRQALQGICTYYWSGRTRMPSCNLSSSSRYWKDWHCWQGHSRT